MFKKLGMAALATSLFSGSAFAEDNTRDMKNWSCTDHGNGSFSINVDGYDEPMLTVKESSYGLDSNHAVLVHMPDNHPNVYKGKFTELETVSVSDKFKSALNNFNGRVLLQYKENRCLLEEHFPKQNAIRTSTIRKVPFVQKQG